MSSKIPLLLFAKAPIAGKVKTRLQPHCSTQQSAEIAQILLQITAARATQYWPGLVVLSVGLNKDHPSLQSIAHCHQIELVAQCEGDLGAKMHHAFERYGYPAAVMGCDAPHFDASVLSAAHAELEAGNNVIGPSEDGGYYLLGLQQSAPSIFENVNWGGEQVFADTLKNADRELIKFHRLTELNDIDRWADVQSVADKLPALKAYLAENNL